MPKNNQIVKGLSCILYQENCLKIFGYFRQQAKHQMNRNIRHLIAKQQIWLSNAHLADERDPYLRPCNEDRHSEWGFYPKKSSQENTFSIHCFYLKCYRFLSSSLSFANKMQTRKCIYSKQWDFLKMQC